MSLRLFTMCQDYRSHAIASDGYRDIFKSLPDDMVTLVDDPDDADVSYLHMETEKAAVVLSELPSLKKTYRIGYCVWEADTLPPSYRRSIGQFNEVWTASFHNWLAFDAAHDRVIWMPHVIKPQIAAAQKHIDAMRTMLQLGPDDFIYLNIGENLPRKNMQGLMEAFHHVHKRRPNARLVIKTASDHSKIQIRSSGPIINCEANLSHEQLGALYALCHVYVSAHFAEGWGLTLSEAMGHKRLCVANGYSGNRDFMTAANSLLVNYTLSPIRPKHCYYFFTSEMSWGYPHQESLEQQMLTAYELVRTQQASRLIARATQDIRHFDARHIRLLVRSRLKTIAKLLGRS